MLPVVYNNVCPEIVLDLSVQIPVYLLCGCHWKLCKEEIVKSIELVEAAFVGRVAWRGGALWHTFLFGRPGGCNA